MLFGLDGQGRPLAATFAADQTALALKAATSLKLQTLRVETAEQTDLAKQLPVGAILVAGRATVPLVSKALFDKLLALRPTSADPPRGDAPAAASPQLPATAETENTASYQGGAWLAFLNTFELSGSIRFWQSKPSCRRSREPHKALFIVQK